jgi:hypothetical protein
MVLGWTTYLECCNNELMDGLESLDLDTVWSYIIIDVPGKRVLNIHTPPLHAGFSM